jgi:hypothetical protein
MTRPKVFREDRHSSRFSDLRSARSNKKPYQKREASARKFKPRASIRRTRHDSIDVDLDFALSDLSNRFPARPYAGEEAGAHPSMAAPRFGAFYFTTRRCCFAP